MYKGKYIKYLTASRRRKYPQRTLSHPKIISKLVSHCPNLKPMREIIKLCYGILKKKHFPNTLPHRYDYVCFKFDVLPWTHSWSNKYKCDLLLAEEVDSIYIHLYAYFPALFVHFRLRHTHIPEPLPPFF